MNININIGYKMLFVGTIIIILGLGLALYRYKREYQGKNNGFIIALLDVLDTFDEIVIFTIGDLIVAIIAIVTGN